MKNVAIATSIIIFLGFVNIAGAVMAEESLMVQGRSIPENSIAVTLPATSVESVQSVKTPPPPAIPPTGDPDFDLLRMATPPPSSGLRGSNSGVGEIKAKTIPTVSNEGRDRAKGESDASAGAGSAGERTAIGDPDFDLLNISVGGNDLEKFRSEVSSTDTTKKVIVRGWDPVKKEEIIARPEEVETSEDLEVYVEAVALSDEAIKDIRIKKDVIEVESREPGKLFWFIPVQVTRTVAVNFNLKDSSADSIDVKFSWWHVFVKKAESAADTKQEITTELNLLKMEDMKRVRSESTISAYAATLKTISSVMKTKHDTVKNSIGNIR